MVRRYLVCVVLGIIVVLGGVVGAGPVYANGVGNLPPGPTPDGEGNFVVCANNEGAQTWCNYGIYAVGDVPTQLVFVGGQVAVNAANGTFYAFTFSDNLSEIQVKYSDGTTRKASMIVGGTDSGPPQESFASGLSGVPDADNPDPIFQGFKQVQTNQVSAIGMGLSLIVSVVIAAGAVGLLVKYARRAVRSA